MHGQRHVGVGGKTAAANAGADSGQTASRLNLIFLLQALNSFGGYISLRAWTAATAQGLPCWFRAQIKIGMQSAA